MDLAAETSSDSLLSSSQLSRQKFNPVLSAWPQQLSMVTTSAAAGVILWEVCSHEPMQLGLRRPLRSPDDCPPVIAALQVACCAQDASNRPSMMSVCRTLGSTGLTESTLAPSLSHPIPNLSTSQPPRSMSEPSAEAMCQTGLITGISESSEPRITSQVALTARQTTSGSASRSTTDTTQSSANSAAQSVQPAAPAPSSGSV